MLLCFPIPFLFLRFSLEVATFQNLMCTLPVLASLFLTHVHVFMSNTAECFLNISVHTIVYCNLILNNALSC